MKLIVFITSLVAVLCAAFVAVLVGTVFALTRPVVDASEQFLGLVGEGRIDEAYAATAAGFRAKHDAASFATAVRKLGLTDYASATWESRQIENQDGTAEGTVVTKNGETRAVAVWLVREDGSWKVVGLRYGGVDLTAVDVRPTAPGDNDP